MSKPYEAKLFNPTINYRGSDESMVEYLSELWKEEICRDSSNITEEETIKDYGVKDYGIKDLTNFKNTLSKVSNNLVFKGNFGCYNNALEKEMSLTKKSIIMNKKQCLELYLCLNDLIRYNSIRTTLFDNIKYATIFIKHKNGEDKDPKNFRFLSNHSNCFKILDKFWTNSLITTLTRNNSLPDKNIVRNNFDRTFTISIRDLAFEKLSKFKNGSKIILLDIRKAFDSVSWDVLKGLLIKNLTRKINKNSADKIVEQYMFLNTSRCIKFNSKTIKFNKSIATGLPSSTIVFSLLIEQLIFEWMNKEKCDSQVLINTFVDDMYLEFKDTSNAQELVESLIEYLNNSKLMINTGKTKTNIDGLPYDKINKSDCYLGMPFALNEKDYIEECLAMFKDRYYDIEVENIIDILESDDHIKIRREILGFFNYKLYGLKTFGRDEINVLAILKFYKTLQEIQIDP